MPAPKSLVGLGIALTPLEKAYWAACAEYKNRATRVTVYEKREAYLTLFWRTDERMFDSRDEELRCVALVLRALQGSMRRLDENTAKARLEAMLQDWADARPLTVGGSQAAIQAVTLINKIMEVSQNEGMLADDSTVINTEETVDEEKGAVDTEDKDDVMDMEEIMRADLAATGLQKLSPELQYFIRFIGDNEELLEDAFDFGCFLGLDKDD